MKDVLRRDMDMLMGWAQGRLDSAEQGQIRYPG